MNNFEYIVEQFKKLHIILLKSKICNENCIQSKLKLLDLGVNTASGYEWMIELIDFNKNIINYFDTLDKDYCKKYHEDRINYPNIPTKLPEIYVDFKLFVLYLVDEKYEKLDNMRLYILNKYNI